MLRHYRLILLIFAAVAVSSWDSINAPDNVPVHCQPLPVATAPVGGETSTSDARASVDFAAWRSWIAREVKTLAKRATETSAKRIVHMAMKPAVASEGRPTDRSRRSNALLDATAAERHDDPAPAIDWLTDYDEAMTRAERQNRMLFVYFCDACGQEPCNRFKTETLDDSRVQSKLREYVCLRLSLDAQITIKGQSVRVLEHPAFAEMLGRPGIAIVDFRSSNPKLRGSVASMFPITERLWYTPERMVVILNLPAGTLTQRTLIFAVRIHPEKPASAESELNPDLVAEAQQHSQYQARIRTQGHQFWETRFHRIVSRLPGGLSAREVCAESWPGQTLVEAAIECVRCWRLSSGHWSAVRASNRCFAYDMRRGSNGVWYATGIFGAR